MQHRKPTRRRQSDRRDRDLDVLSAEVERLRKRAGLLTARESGGGSADSSFSSGDIKLSARPTPETGWLLCDGSAVSRTDYADLYAALGDTYGAGDGSTTFNLPDLTDAFPLGAGTHLLGEEGGEETHVLTIAEMPAHTHTLGNALQHPSENTGSQTRMTQGGTSNATGSTGGGGAHNNMPPYLALNYFIKE